MPVEESSTTLKCVAKPDIYARRLDLAVLKGRAELLVGLDMLVNVRSDKINPFVTTLDKTFAKWFRKDYFNLSWIMNNAKPNQ